MALSYVIERNTELEPFQIKQSNYFERMNFHSSSPSQKSKNP